MATSFFIARHQEALRQLLPKHAREREHSSRKWSVSWSDGYAVWTITVVDPSMGTWYVKVASDGTEDHGWIRTAHMEAIEPPSLLKVLEGLGALPYAEPGSEASGGGNVLPD
jgi:hypothetical protein